jgi:hypothetical protein
MQRPNWLRVCTNYLTRTTTERIKSTVGIPCEEEKRKEHEYPHIVGAEADQPEGTDAKTTRAGAWAEALSSHEQRDGRLRLRTKNWGEQADKNLCDDWVGLGLI